MSDIEGIRVVFGGDTTGLTDAVARGNSSLELLGQAAQESGNVLTNAFSSMTSTMNTFSGGLSSSTDALFSQSEAISADGEALMSLNDIMAQLNSLATDQQMAISADGEAIVTLGTVMADLAAVAEENAAAMTAASEAQANAASTAAYLASTSGGIAPALTQAADAADQEAAAMSRAKESGEGFSLGMGDLVTHIGMGIFAFQSIIQIAGQAVQALFAPAMSIEETTSSLEVFTGSAAKAKAELQALSQFASHTPFQTQDIDNAALKMQSVGINAKQVIPYIQALGDALDATGRLSSADLNMIVDDFDKIKTQGHLTTDVMNSFAIQGVDAWSILEKQTGKTHDQLADMISKGLYPAKQAMDDLTKGIEKNPLYAGQMANDTANMTGILSTLKSNFDQVLGAFASPILKAVEPMFNNLATTLSAPAFQAFAGNVGKGIVSVFTNLGGAVSTVGKYLGSFDLTGIVSSFKNLGSAVGGILSPLQNLGANKEVTTFFSGLKNALSHEMVDIIKGVSGFINTLATGLKNLGTNKGVIGFLDSLKSGFQQVGQIVGGQIGQDFQFFGQTVQQLGKWFQTSMLPAIQQAMPGFEHLGSVLATTVAPALAKIWSVGQQVTRDVMPPLIKGFETIEPVIVRVGGFLADNLGKALQFVAPFAVRAAQEIGKFATEIATRVQPIIENIYDGIKMFLDWIAPYWPEIWGTIQNVFQSTWDTIAGIIQVAWSVVSGIIKVGLDLMSGNWGQAWTDVKDMFSGIWDGIKTIASGVMEYITAPIQGGMNGLKSWWSNAWDSIKHTFSNIWDNIKHIATGAWDGISGAIKGGINGAITLINDFIRGVDSIHVSLPGGVNIGFNIPEIPYLAMGGIIQPGQFAFVGERGMELIGGGTQGVSVLGTSQTAALLDTNTAALLGSTGYGSSAPVVIENHVHTHNYIDGREMLHTLGPRLVRTVMAHGPVKGWGS